MKIFICTLFIGLIMWSCNSPDSPKVPVEHISTEKSINEPEDNWVPDVYKTSELAELMRQMHADHLDLKKKIEEGKLDLVKNSNYSFIHKAQPTDPNDDTPLFHTYADAYLLVDSMIYSGRTTDEYKDKFNDMVNACIACHQNFCMGPINKIELLRIGR